MFCQVVYSPAPTLERDVPVATKPASSRPPTRTWGKDLLLLLLITIGAVLVHGYHPWAEDAEIYLPGIEKTLQPDLFPFNAQFFETHAHSTFYPNLIAASARSSHLPLEAVTFIWQLASIFLFLLACRCLAVKCFSDPAACWAGVLLIAALLTLPIAGTALYILDQYLNPRNLSAFAQVFAIVRILDRKYLQAGLFLLFAAAVHPFMALFAISYCGLLIVVREFDLRLAAFAAFLPFGLTLDPPPKTYHLAIAAHSFHYITRWHWYEWLGALAPLGILWWFSHLARSRQRSNLDLLCRTLLIYELAFLPVALLLSIPARLEALGRLQPMRCLYLLYILMFLFAGTLLGEYILKRHWWRWVLFFAPLAAGMFVAQLVLFPGTPHVEWPGVHSSNAWEQAFVWVRDNTPRDAIFALDPQYIKIPGEDAQGFRAVAQRSRMADRRDAGAVSMFPEMSDEWYRQIQAQSGWKTFQIPDFQRLGRDYGVSWVVLQQPGVSGLDCPFHNTQVLVCRLND